MPLISIIVPVYNVEKYLHRCINSILTQSLTDFELILVDDGSTDNSGKICDEYSAEDERIIVIHKPNGGQAEARNFGIDWVFNNSNSEWLSFVDSDDWIEPTYLETLHNTVVSLNSVIGICDFLETDGNAQRNSIMSYDASIMKTEDFFCGFSVLAVVPWAKLFSRYLFNKVRFPAGKIHEDEFIMYKVLFCIDELAFVQAPLYNYYQNPTSTMKKKWNVNRLSIMDAKDEQLSFFKEMNYLKAYEKTVDSYAMILCIMISEIKGNKELIISERVMRKRLKELLADHRNGGAFSKEHINWYLETAYPKRKQFQYFINAQINKFKYFKK